MLVIPGGILFGLAGIALLLRAGVTPNYLSVWFPSSLLIGVGIGLCLPVLGSAAVQGLAASRFAVGSHSIATRTLLIACEEPGMWGGWVLK